MKTACASRARLVDMDDLEHIITIVIVCGASLFFAAMAWASSHQS